MRGSLSGRAANAGGIAFALYAVLFVLLNAVPESIYQKGVYGGLAAIQASISFIQENWIEWFIPNVAFGAALWFGWPRLVALPLDGRIVELIIAVVVGGFVHTAMVFRGFLFEALDGTTARQRDLRYRLGR